MFPAFDEHLVARQIERLDWRFSLAFGAACASRLLPNYERFANESGWGLVDPIRRALDFVCGIALDRNAPTEAECRLLIAECEAQTPDSEDFDSLFTSSAQDAVFAICSLLDFCIERKPEQVVMAARYPTDSIDLYVQEKEQISPQDPSLESRILAHPLMQQELMRQARDLTSLRAGNNSGLIEVLNRRGTEEAFRASIP